MSGSLLLVSVFEKTSGVGKPKPTLILANILCEIYNTSGVCFNSLFCFRHVIDP